MPYKSKAAAAAAARRRRARQGITPGATPRATGRRRQGDVGGRPIKHTPEVLRAILDAMLKPYTGLEKAAEKLGVSVSAIMAWQKQSAQDEAAGVSPSPWVIDYLGNVAPFHRHMAFVRAVMVARIDHRIIEAATSSHFEPLFNQQTGVPHWVVDAKVAADAKSMDDFDWEMAYHPRDRSDIYKRNDAGELIQATREVAPNPQLLIKAASSLLSQTYGERVAHTLTIGGVVRIGPSMAPAPKQLAPAPTYQTLDADFTPIDEEATEPTNVLMVGEEPATVEEFERTFGGKRLVEAILFYAEDGKLLPPLADIVIVEGSSAHKAYVDAGVEVDAVPAAPLVALGYRNDFLLPLAKQEDVDAAQAAAEAREAEAKAAHEERLRHNPRAYMAGTGEKPQRPVPGRNEPYTRVDGGERVGYGNPPPGGVSVTRFPQRSILR